MAYLPHLFTNKIFAGKKVSNRKVANPACTII